MKNYNVLTLAEALQQWCDPLLVLQVMEWEPQCTASEVDSLRRIHLTNRSFQRDATLTNVTTNPHMRLRSAWSDLEHDLCHRLEQGLIYLRGVRVAPDRRTEPEIIPGVWAAAFRFDFSRGLIAIGDLCFAAVACSLDPWESEATPTAAQSPTIAAKAEPTSQLRPEDVPALNYETVLSLLEAHAQHVIKNGDQLIAPGKVSLLAIVRSKMKDRAAAGEMLPTLSSEARWLANWIEQRAPDYQPPTENTINRQLSTTYNQLNPRSTPAIQKEKI